MRLLAAEEVKQAVGRPWLRQREVAELSGIKPETLRTRIKRGQIPARPVRPGGKRVIWIADLEKKAPDVWDALVAKIERTIVSPRAHTVAEQTLPLEMTLAKLAKLTDTSVRVLRYKAKRGLVPTRRVGSGKRARRVVLVDELRTCTIPFAVVLWRRLNGEAVDFGARASRNDNGAFLARLAEDDEDDADVESGPA